MDSGAFRSVRPRCAIKTRLRPVPKLIQSKAKYSSRVLRTLIGCLRLCRGVARPKVQKSGHSRIIEFRPFRLIHPWFACEAGSSSNPKLIQSKAKYKSRVSRTLIGGLRPYDGVERLKSLKSRAFTDPWIPGHIGQFPFVSRNQDMTKTCSKVDSIQGNVQALGLKHSDRRPACKRWRGKAQVVEKDGYHGPIPAISVSSPSVLVGDKTKTCPKGYSVQCNVQT
jgi:hypothetical protein